MFVRSILAVFAVCLLAAIAAPPPASADTWNHTWRYLRFPSTKGNNDDAGDCITRHLVTGPGTYRWKVFNAHWAHTNQEQSRVRTVKLRRANWKWTMCWNSIAGGGWGNYSQFSTPGSLYTLVGPVIKGNFGDGRYHIGSTIVNVRA